MRRESFGFDAARTGTDKLSPLRRTWEKKVWWRKFGLSSYAWHMTVVKPQHCVFTLLSHDPSERKLTLSVDEHSQKIVYIFCVSGYFKWFQTKSSPVFLSIRIKCDVSSALIHIWLVLKINKCLNQKSILENISHLLVEGVVRMDTFSLVR